MRFENLTNYFNSRRYDFSALALALPGLRQTSAIPANKDGPKHDIRMLLSLIIRYLI